MPQAVRDTVMASAAAWEQYPDALCRKLRRAAADFYEADGTPIQRTGSCLETQCFGYFVCSCLSNSTQTGDFAGWIFGYEQALRMCGCGSGGFI